MTTLLGAMRSPGAATLLGATLLAACAPPARPNLLLISIDTLRADRLGYAGSPRPTSPAIDRLAGESLVFERAYSQAGWTLPSMGTVLTGLYPSEHGGTEVGRGIHRDILTLASLLGEHGYSSWGCVSQLFLTATYGFDAGFDDLDTSPLDVGRPIDVSTAPVVTDAAIDRLESTSEPFFLWVHYFDPHTHYLAHPEVADFGSQPIDRYESEIAYTDRHVERLLDRLESLGLAEETVVVLTADHGEEFHEHGHDDHHSLFEEDVRIPLLVRAPGLAHRLVRRPAQQIDIVPTVIDLLGLEAPQGLPGRSLVASETEQRPIFMERRHPWPFVQRAVISGNLKLYRIAVEGADELDPADLDKRMRKLGLRPGTWLFDLAADPGERRNLYRPGEPRSEQLEELLDNWTVETHAGEEVEMSEQLRRGLESLGYLD